MAKDKDKKEESGKKEKSAVREYVEAILIALLLALVIRTYIVQAFKIPSGSMLDTLQIGDHILVNKFAYWFDNPKHHDVIVFKFPQDETRDFIKRIIGIEYDKIRGKDKVLFVNGEKQDEPYVVHKDSFTIPGRNQNLYGDETVRDTFGPLTVPASSYFCMGDNRDRSLDSRFWGFVRREKIKGKAFIIYWSWDSKGKLLDCIRWGRLGSRIQ
ncbi:MAG: signal peptidase I [Candidatus Schekmanbacteria bacterium]|nr:signal peptidase I [Candidatus Schekmanbacteria bacterium]